MTTERLLAEIARQGSTRLTIAAVYRELIEASGSTGDFVDWPTVNRAILDRFMPSGLNYIKRMAWKR